MRLSPAFLLKFFGLAAVLFALWSFAGCGDAYGRLVIGAATPLIEPLTDCEVGEVRNTDRGLSIEIRRTDPSDGKVYQRTVPLQPREVFSGLIPFLALMGATGGLSWARRARATAIGVGVLFVFHFGLMLLGPYLTGLPQAHLGESRLFFNRAVNVAYGYLGFITLYGMPFLLWFGLGARRSEVGGRGSGHPPES